MAAKFSLLTVVAVPLLPLIPLLACGGDDGGKTVHVVDAPNGSGSGSGSGSQQATCTAQSSYGTVAGFAAQGAQYSAGSASDMTNELIWQGQLNGSAMDALEVLIFGGCGSGIGSQCGGTQQSPAGTPDWPTTFGPKSNIDLAMAPDAVVLVLSNLNTAQMKYQDLYLATAGTLNVTAASNTAGATFAGNASNVQATHILITQQGITEAPDGCTTSVTAFSFTGSAAAGAQGKATMIYGANRDEALTNYLRHRFQK